MVILSSIVLTIILVFTGFFVYEYITYKEILVNDLLTKADLIADNSNAALLFRDSSDAADVLNSLSSQPNVIAAAIYDIRGNIFSTFVRLKENKVIIPLIPEKELIKFEDEALIVFRPIKLNNREIGTIYLRNDLVAQQERFWSYLQITLIVLLGSLIVTYLVAVVFAKNLSNPIMELAETSQKVSQSRDYSIRASVTTEDETGFLAESFNQMLIQIQKNDESLRKTNETLRINQLHKESLLRLSQKLEQAETFSEALIPVCDEVKKIMGFQNIWVYLFSKDGKAAELITMSGEMTKIIDKTEPIFKIDGDVLLEAIYNSNDPLVIEDARIDARTNKSIVEKLQNRTIVSVPMVLGDKKFGALGTGSFGSEGVIIPDEFQIDYFCSMANHVAVAFERIQLLKERKLAEEEVYKLNVELEQRVIRRTAELQAVNIDLRKTQDFLNSIVENIPATIFLKDAKDLSFVRLNRAGENLFGYKREEVFGKNDYDIFPKDEADFFTSTDRAVLNGNQILDIPEEFIHTKYKGMRILHTRKITIRDENGEPQYLLGISEDITNQKLAEFEIKRQKQEVQDFIDSMSTFCIKVSTDGTLLMVNKIVQQAADLPIDKLLRTNFLYGNWFTYDPVVHERVLNSFRKACEGTEINYDENIYLFGKIITMNLSMTPILDSKNKVDYIIVEGRDVTPLKLAEKTLVEKTLELESINKELEAFSYSVSHDLRAPLRAINGYAKILEEDYNSILDVEGKRLLNVVQNNAKKMGDLIDNLLIFSKLGRQEVRKTKVDMNELVESVLTEIKKNHGNNLEIKTGVLHPVPADLLLIKQVLINLISNAAKYSQNNENPLIEIKSEKGKEEIIYLVKDNGVGFDMRYADKLFGVFQRLHTEEEFEGTGVGLAIVQRIVTKHGGRVWAAGDINKGATFYFSLPAKIE
jgi:PAS domain S-box-containing protein